MDKKIKIFQFIDEHLKDLQAILLEYMTFIAKSMIKPPWNYSIDVEGEVNFTMSNLDKFKEPDGRLLLVEVDGQIAGTISMRKIREIGPSLTWLVPGIGAQGGDLEQSVTIPNSNKGVGIINVSRSIIYSGNQSLDEIRNAAINYNKQINKFLIHE